MSPSLKQRLITAAVAAPIGLAIVWLLPVPWFSVLVAIMVILGGWEWAAMTGWQDPRLRLGYAAVVAVLIGITAMLDQSVERLEVGLALAAWAIALVWLRRFPIGDQPDSRARYFKRVLGLVILVGGWAALDLLHRLGDGPLRVTFVLGLIWAADGGAYFVGKRFGKHKLAPTISPGKTWEGAVGGMLAATLVALVFALGLNLPSREAATLVVVAIAVAAISIGGDLYLSLLKRHAAIKDSGRVFPGHGGVLDRFDSLLAAAPLAVCGLYYVAGL